VSPPPFCKLELIMSKFRRVSELTTPEYLKKAVDGNFEGDPYAHLKEASAKRKLKIAKNTQDYKPSKSDIPHEWEGVFTQETYQDFKFPLNEKEAMTNSLGSHNRIVRKSEYLDEDFSARDLESQLKPFTPEQYTQAMLKGASIWNPDMEEIAEAFKVSQLSESEAALANRETRDTARTARHESWENNSVSQLKKSKYSTSRASPLLKTQNEVPVDGSMHSIIDWGALDGREQQKLAMRENRRKASQEIKSVGRSREEVHQAWEDDLDINTESMRDYYSGVGVDLNID